MKKVFLTLAAIAFTAASVVANNNPKTATVEMAAYKVADGTGVKLIVLNTAGENVTVHIKNKNGKVVFTDVVRQESRFSRKYVFDKTMEGGEYTIEVVNSKDVASQSVSL
ncbi:MAG: hypothetical protein MUD08_13400 [Cytophagales bacterium]|nr:hypothetical protein [Cytophagales bacterium]